MKNLIVLTLALLVCLPAFARDTRHKYMIEEALDTIDAKSKIDEDIKLYFGKTKHPKIVDDHGVYTSNKKTNAFNKSDHEACKWVFLSAVLQLQKKARALGANAVVGIESVYKNEKFVSSKKYMCGAGAVMAGVAFKGRVVTLKK